MKVRVIFVGCSFMSKINLELLVLTVKTVKKNPVVWVIPLLLMLILSKLIIYPREWIRFWSINSTDRMFVFISLIKAAAIIAASAFLFSIIVTIVKIVFQGQRRPLLLEVKENFFPLSVLIITVLLPLNFFYEVIFEFLYSPGMMGYFWNYLLVFMKSIFFYYVLYSGIEKELTTEKSLYNKLKNSFSRGITIKLLIISLSISIITTPIFYYTNHKPFQPINLWVDFSVLLFQALIHTFLIIYSGVLYYKQMDRYGSTV